MDIVLVVLWIIGILIPIVVSVVAVYYFSAPARRRRRLRALARSMGLSFDSSKDQKFNKRFSDLKCLCRGVSRYACNVMKGQWKDRPILAFDYHYQDGNAEYNFSAVIITSPIPLKPLYIRPERAVHRLMDFFGFEDINFESAEFSRKFYVKSPDRQWAYDVIHQRMIEYLLPIPEFGIQFGSKYVIA